MRVSWDTKFLGTFHKDVTDEELLEFVGSLAKLGFTADVTMED